MKSFFSLEEGQAFIEYDHILKFQCQPFMKLRNLGEVSEKFLNILLSRNGIAYESLTISEIITYARKIVPNEIHWIGKDERDLFKALKNFRDISTHVGGAAFHSYSNKLEENFNLFVDWYCTKYSLQDWRQILHNNYEFYQEKIKIIYEKKIPLIDIQIIKISDFENERIPDEESLQKLSVEYYTHFINTPNKIKRIVANNIHIKLSYLVQIDKDAAQINVTLESVLKEPSIGKPKLIKILGPGGVGKSTLFWHLAKMLCATNIVLYLKRFDPESIEQLLRSYNINDDLNIYIFIDDASEYTPTRFSLKDIASCIDDNSKNLKVSLILLDRIFLYNKYKDINEFEAYFSGNVETFFLFNNEIKLDYFEHLYSIIVKEKIYDETNKAKLFKIFNSESNSGLVDSSFKLIFYLKANFPESISYKFEWDEWADLTINENAFLLDIFMPVAFFYQFGVSVPVAYVQEFYPDIKNALIKLLNFLGNDNSFSPIVLQKVDDKLYLGLKNKTTASWYFNRNTYAYLEGEQFLIDFLKKIDTSTKSYLFRNICRKNIEFSKSDLGKKYLQPQDILNIVEEYLLRTNKSSFEKGEKDKMMFEKFYALKNLDKNAEAIGVLKEIVISSPDNYQAYTALGNEMCRVEPEEAEKMYLIAQKYTEAKHYANLNLFRLYTLHPTTHQFKKYENIVFREYKEKRIDYIKLLEFIKSKIEILPNSTVKHLFENLDSDPEHIYEISLLFLHKNKPQQALELLKSIKNSSIKSPLLKNKICSILLTIVQNGIYDETIIKLAQDILMPNLLIYINESNNSYLLMVKSLRLQKSQDNYPEIKTYLDKVKDKKIPSLFQEICKYYIEYSRSVMVKSTTKAITIITEGLIYADGYPLPKDRNQHAYYITERCLLRMELVKIYTNIFFIESQDVALFNLIRDSQNTISSLLTEENRYLDSVFLPANRYRHTHNHSSIQNYIKIKTTSYNFCQLENRILKELSKLRSNEKKLLVEETDRKALQYLKDALEYDNDDNDIIFKLIELKIKTRDYSFMNEITQIDSYSLNSWQKINLIHSLYISNYTKEGDLLVEKFKKLEAPNDNTKNILAECYLRAKKWRYASDVILSFTQWRGFQLKHLRDIALNMPSDTMERIELKIKFSEIYLAHSSINTSEMHINICKNLYIGLRISKSLGYYTDNYKEIANNIRNISFEELSTYWHLGYIENYIRLINKVRTNSKKSSFTINLYRNLIEISKDLISIGLNYGKFTYKIVDNEIITINKFKVAVYGLFDILLRDTRNIKNSALYTHEIQIDFLGLVKPRNGNEVIIQIFYYCALIKLAHDSKVLSDITSIVDSLETLEINEFDSLRLKCLMRIRRNFLDSGSKLLKHINIIANEEPQKLSAISDCEIALEIAILKSLINEQRLDRNEILKRILALMHTMESAIYYDGYLTINKNDLYSLINIIGLQIT